VGNVRQEIEAWLKYSFQTGKFGRIESSLKKVSLFPLTPSKPVCLNSDSHRGRIADCTGTKKTDFIHIVCHCSALAWERYRTLGRVSLIPKALENTRVNDSNKPDSRYQAWHRSLFPLKSILKNSLRYTCPGPKMEDSLFFTTAVRESRGQTPALLIKGIEFPFL
jgi:hypothetical protein